ncbi:alpha-hydroxy-acid oxidizing protein, partial [Gemmata sp.]|uniref:alpha-hydroxy-acid oxidizing protein n=1 Tax=Gemmata sp. TaxID=1914242 RepID=UPI003F70EE35
MPNVTSRAELVVDRTPPPGRPAFQTGRQLAVYRAGPRAASNAIPVAAEELAARAKARLSPEAWDWIAGGAGRGETVRANRDAFAQWRIVPRVLCDVADRDFSTALFGARLPAPLLFAPVGVQTLLHPDGELATARAAADLGLPFVLSTVASKSIEDVAAAGGPGPRWFQLYWSRDREVTRSLLRRAERAGYAAVVVTLDTPILGWRERSLDLGYLPFLRGEGLANYTSDPAFRAGLPGGRADDTRAVVEHYLRVFSNPGHTWDDLDDLRAMTRLPVLVKGVQHPDDARRAVDGGCDGVVVSNHGGRQVEGAVGSLECLPGVARAVGGRVPVLFDSGVRRGADVVKALALGAAAVLVGRPYLWALAVNGADGVREFGVNLLADLDLTLALAGKRTLAGLGPED